MWQSKKISQLCDIQSGLWKGKKGPFTEAYVLRNTNFTSSGKFNYSDVAILQVETRQLEKRLVLPNDIILEKSGGGEKTPVGRVCLHKSELDKPVSLSNFTARLRVLDEKELAPEFLHLFLHFLYISGKTESMQRNSTGIRNLQITQYKDIDVPLPPLIEQQRIVSKIYASFSEIDKSLNNIKIKTEELSLLRTNIIKNKFKKVFGNVQKQFSEVCTLKRGYDLPKSERVKGKFPLLSANGISDYINNFKINGPGVVTGRSGTIGKVHFVENDFHPLNTALYVEDFKGNFEKYIYYFLKSFKLKRFSSGAGVPTLNRNVLSNEIVFINPKREIQIEISETLDFIELEIGKLILIMHKKELFYKSLKSAFLRKFLRF